MPIEDGGAAFPLSHDITSNSHPREIRVVYGMSLRDYFAAKAMEALIGAMLAPGSNMAKHNPTITNEDAISLQAFEFADSMLKVRKR